MNCTGAKIQTKETAGGKQTRKILCVHAFFLEEGSQQKQNNLLGDKSSLLASRRGDWSAWWIQLTEVSLALVPKFRKRREIYSVTYLGLRLLAPNGTQWKRVWMFDHVGIRRCGSFYTRTKRDSFGGRKTCRPPEETDSGRRT